MEKEVYIPNDEKLKRELIEKFTTNSTYLGSFVKQVISQTDFKVLRVENNRPSFIRKGDVIILPEGAKTRPCVVVKVLKDRTVVYIPLTSTENVHCLTPYKNRFFREGCFTKTFSVCTEETAIENFCGVFDNMKDLNRAIKELREFTIQNLK